MPKKIPLVESFVDSPATPLNAQFITRVATQLIEQDTLRQQALNCLQLLNLPQGYIAAGFLRNLVWDHLHNKSVATPLNDIDVIYFDLYETDINKCQEYQKRLETMIPAVNWQVKNQVLMHKRNDDKPYKSSLDAMRYWPEKETAVAIRQLVTGEFECIAAFGFDSLFSLALTHNPKREKSVFEQRFTTKKWLSHWPKLTVII